jgi:hypothetical protein
VRSLVPPLRLVDARWPGASPILAVGLEQLGEDVARLVDVARLQAELAMRIL